MAEAVRSGTAAALGDVLPARRLAAKTGTAQTSLPSGAPATVSWVTILVDDALVLTVAVEPSTSRPDPAASDGSALDVARRVLPAVAAGIATPSSACVPGGRG
jgi:hypothetical protein